MDWIAFIKRLEPAGMIPHFRPPAKAGEIDAIEAEFGVRLPAAHRELLEQTDGVFDQYECAILDGVGGIARMNNDAREECRSDSLPFDRFLFVSSMYGNGDLVGYGVTGNRSENPPLYRWDHETDTWAPEAADFAAWLERLRSSGEGHSDL